MNPPSDVGLRELGNVQASLDYVLKHNPSETDRILDVGCNYGSLLNRLHERGYVDVYGVDVSTGHIDAGRDHYPSIAERIQAYEGTHLPFADEHFDIVVLFDVLEHIPDVDRFLAEEVRRVLRGSGRFLFQTPNKFFNVPWEILKSRSLVKYREFHCSLQTYSSLKQLLRRCGFVGVVLERHGLLSEYKRRKARKVLGVPGLLALHASSCLPCRFSPNLWGYCRKA